MTTQPSPAAIEAARKFQDTPLEVAHKRDCANYCGVRRLDNGFVVPITDYACRCPSRVPLTALAAAFDEYAQAQFKWRFDNELEARISRANGFPPRPPQ